MKTTLRRIGIALCAVGFSLTVFATGALFTTPADPTGAGDQYDHLVESFNEQMQELAETDPNFPALPLGKTRLQMHREDATFGLVVGGVMTAIGVALYCRNRTGREHTAAS